MRGAVPGVLRHIELNIMERDLHSFPAKSIEDIQANGRRRIELWISR